MNFSQEYVLQVDMARWPCLGPWEFPYGGRLERKLPWEAGSLLVHSLKVSLPRGALSQEKKHTVVGGSQGGERDLDFFPF